MTIKPTKIRPVGTAGRKIIYQKTVNMGTNCSAIHATSMVTKPNFVIHARKLAMRV